MSRLIRTFATSSCLFVASAAAATPQPTIARIGLGPADLSARAPAIAAPLSAPALPPADTGHFIIPFADPGFADTTPNDVNDHGTMVGHFQLTPDFFATVSGDNVLTLDNPAVRLTSWSGITDNGVLVGSQILSNGMMAIPLPR